MTAISDLSAAKAVGAGLLFVSIAVKQWVFTLSAIGVISEAGLGEAANIGLYLFYVLATQTLVLTPVLMYAVAPRQTARPLKAAQTWLERYNRAIVIAVSLVLGVWFLYKGMGGLIG
jgi:cadmium resistance protein CadD (predicted permease)